MTRTTRHLISLLCMILPVLPALASHGHEGEVSSKVRFIENKGQWENQVLYAASLPIGRVFLEQDRLTYVFCDVSDLHDRYFHRTEDDGPPRPLDCHSFTVKFPGANLSALVQGAHPEPHYYNYFTGQDPSRWASRASLFEQITYRDIYPGIDLVLHGRDAGLKYEFVVAPGADPRQIELRYEGLTGIATAEGQLQLTTEVLTIIEEEPYAYQAATEIPCDFQLNGTTVRFALPNGYDPNRELVIDPTLVFSTFTGSFADNFGFTATYDDSGNLFAGGITYGPGYPATTGAFQVPFGGGLFDMSISKFGPNGTHLWSSYLGGSDVDQPHSLIANDLGELFIMGRTNSNNFPVVAGSYDVTHNGDADIIVSKLNPNGNILLGSTYIGGAQDDAINITTAYTQSSIKYNYGDDARGEVVLDDNGDVYVAACTRSSNFPVTAGAIQAFPASTQDGCVCKLSSDLTTLVWSTYLGGSDDDAAYSLKVDGSGNTFVAGGTASNDFPTSPGSYQATKPGGIDGFITKINPAGNSIVTSTYIGTADYNQCYFLELDADNDVYVLGQKRGADLVTPGVWSTPTGGQFIKKLNNDLTSIIYSTQFGTSNTMIDFSPTAFLVDVCEYVYVTGWGGQVNFQGNTFGLPTTPNAIQSSTDGSDLYMIVLETDVTAVEFATFMGGAVSFEHVDGGTSRFNKFSEIYHSVCAGCGGNSDFPTTGNAWSNSNLSTNCNLACFKLELDQQGILANFVPNPDTGGCAPHTVLFDNLTVGGNQFFWNFDDPLSGPLNTSTSLNPTHVFNNPGTYNVQLIAIDSSTCNIVDTVYRTIQVFAVPVANITPDTSVCEGESIQLVASGGQSYAWSGGVSNPTSNTVTAAPTTTTTYTVVVTNPGGCADTADVEVSVLPAPTALATGSGFICPGDSIPLSGSGGISYAWAPGNSVSDPNAANTLAFPASSTTYTLTATAANGCEDTDTVQVNVSPIDADPGPDLDLCIGEEVQINASGGSTFTWSPGTGLSNTTTSNPIANPTSSITYFLTVTDTFGCVDTDSLRITVRPLPIVDAGPNQVLLCELDSTLLTASGAINYTWSPTLSLSNPNSGTTFAFPTSTTTYTVVGTDQFGCENNDTLLIEVLPAPIAEAFGGDTICADSSIQVFATGGVSYSWAPAGAFADPTEQNPIATLGATTDLIVTVVGANGCDNYDTVRVPVTPTPEVQIFGGDFICLGDDMTLLALAEGQITWSTGETGPRIRVEPVTDTWYSASTIVDECPSEPDSIQIIVDDQLPIAAFTANPDSGLVPLTTDFINLSQNASSYAWDFRDGNRSTDFSPSHTFQDTGRFDVELIAYNANGCPDTVYQRVIVGADFTIYVPNAFTPNGDGVNDYFATPWIGVREFHVQVYDRWGMLIYESFDPNFKWYGIFKGNDCQEGAYVYVIEASGYIGEKVRKAGSVTLMR
ncbi:MAG: PKD domain-containing protein [Bacteroidota bacterium]